MLGNRRALARVLLRFARGALGRLMGGVFVGRELPGSTTWSLSRVLLRLDGGAFTGLVGCGFIGLEGSSGRTRSGRGRDLRRVAGVRRRGGERTGQRGSDRGARDQRSGDSRDRNDALGWSDASHLLLI